MCYYILYTLQFDCINKNELSIIKKKTVTKEKYLLCQIINIIHFRNVYILGSIFDDIKRLLYHPFLWLFQLVFSKYCIYNNTDLVPPDILQDVTMKMNLQQQILLSKKQKRTGRQVSHKIIYGSYKIILHDFWFIKYLFDTAFKLVSNAELLTRRILKAIRLAIIVIIPRIVSVMSIEHGSKTLPFLPIKVMLFHGRRQRDLYPLLVYRVAPLIPLCITH